MLLKAKKKLYKLCGWETLCCVTVVQLLFIWNLARFVHWFGSLQMMQQLYKECNLVHADLSEYNMLWHDGKVSIFLMM